MGKIHDRLKHSQQRATTMKNLYTGIGTPSSGERNLEVEELDSHERRNAFAKQKYIVVLHPDLGEVALTFPNFLVHREMHRDVFRRLPVISAGFFDIYTDMTVKVYGRSESLDVGSRMDEDPALIERTLGLSN